MTVVTIGHRTTDTFTGLEDTFLLQTGPNSNQSTGDRFNVACVTVGNSKRGLIKVTGITNIPSNATINNASLNLYRINAASPSRNYEVRKLLKNPTVSQTTWNSQLTGTAWQVPGANGATDLDPTVIASGAIPTGGGSTVSITSSAFVALVQGWVSGSISNFGILIQVENDGTAGGGDFDFAGGERSTSSQRPYLTVDYSVPVTPTASIADVTVNNLSGNAVVTITLSSDALAGGVSGTVNTADITAIAGVDYTAQTGVAFSIPEGSASGTITIPILP